MKIVLKLKNNLTRYTPLLHIIRLGHRIRGKPPGVARTLQQRLNDEKIVDPEIEKKIDIGFPPLCVPKKEQRKERMAHVKAQRSRTDLEQKARLQTLLIDLEDVKSEWSKTDGQYHIRNLAHHYGVYEHLFGKYASNIPNGDVSKGETIVPYLQPFPPAGTGYHRHIFILYKQEDKLDFSGYSVKKLNDLDGRIFSTFDFYKKYQDTITPAGLSFFQSTWEKNLTEFYHNVLNMKEPRYEYDFPKPYIRDQMWFPLRQPFNAYLDKYRDEKEIAKEFVERKLAKTHPFIGRRKPLRFPNAHSVKGIPSWLKTEKEKSRLSQGRILDYES